MRLLFSKDAWMELPSRYGGRDVLAFAGLMTYRFVNLFCHPPEGEEGFASMPNLDALITHASDNCFISRFIHLESIATDLVNALKATGVELSSQNEQRILSASKTNPSSRQRSASFFYNPETVALVADRDRLIIEKFGYEPPI
jgi:hypothetical protein